MTANGRILGALATTILVGCSAGPMKVAQSEHDPSSPAAPEGIDPLAAPRAQPTLGHDDDTPAAKEGVVYACPMHPEVTSDAPGVCSKCNMKLVPKK